MAWIRGYLAASLDGYIATPTGGLDWLTKYESADFGDAGYATFIRGIRTVVMGRATYDFVANAVADWPYPNHRTIVVTSSPIEAPRGPIQIWSKGIQSLVAHLRDLDDGDVWMAGGGRLQMAFIEQVALDELEVIIVPELIGDGIRLFPPTGFASSPKLVAARALERDCVYLHYRFTPAEPALP